MSDYDFDLFVIGAGSGGVRAARVASGYGAKVAIAEESRVGGTCVIRGCVPKKLLVYGAHFAEDFEDASAYGWTLPGEPTFSWQTLIANKDKEIDRLNGIYHKLLAGSNVTLFEHRATFKDAHTVVFLPDWDLRSPNFTAANKSCAALITTSVIIWPRKLLKRVSTCV